MQHAIIVTNRPRRRAPDGIRSAAIVSAAPRGAWCRTLAARRGAGRSFDAGLLAAALFIAQAGIGTATGTAAAQTSGDERVSYIARQLERSPLYVSDTLGRVLPEADVRRIRAQIARLPSPAYIAVVPQSYRSADPVRGDELAELLRARVRRPGVYATFDEDGDPGAIVTLGAADTPLEPDDLELAIIQDVPYGAPPATGVLYALELLRTGQRSRQGGGDESGTDTDGAAIIAIALLLFGGLTTRFTRARLRSRARRRKSKPPRRRPPSQLPSAQRVPAPAPQAGPVLVAATGHGEQAVAALARLSGAIERAPEPPAAALDAYAAASKLLEDEHPAIDDVAAMVLVRAGLAALEARDPRPCFFNPLHGGRRRPTRWRLRDEDIIIPACTTCARALRRGRRPESLADAGVPYWERDTIWARTGFGAIDDELPDRILRGEAHR